MHKLRLCGQGVCEQGACGECASQQRGPSSCVDTASVTGLKKRELVTAVHLEVYWFVILFVLGCPLSAGCAIVLVSVAVPLPVLVFRDCWMLAGPFCRRFRQAVTPEFCAGCCRQLVLCLFAPACFSMCSQPSRVLLVARLHRKRVTVRIVVPGCWRGPGRPESRNFCLMLSTMLGLLISNG